ncbi:MAG: ankyrin repeat domain-containing protein [Alphaproteobacteria bacterium]|nr:ankyrin repeat domain-containing protein [Alphaproteobacteria bacterium]
MKYIRILLLGLFFSPVASFAANEFMVAAQLLAAAKNADIQQVQALVNNGADINFVDSTGLSIVCTALMNNDMRAAQILQMYGADASKCDQQIKRYNNRKPQTESGGLFSGLSSAQSLTLAAAGAAVVIGGLLLLTDVLDPGNDNNSGISGGDRPNGGGSSGGNSGAVLGMTLPYGPAMPNAASERENYANNLNYYSPKIPTDATDIPAATRLLAENFKLLTDTYGQNYLLMMHGYSALARGYLGMRTLRNTTSRVPIDLAGNNLGPDPVQGGRPVNVALITANGVNASDDSSLGERLLPWTTTNNNGTAANGASNDMISSKYYNNKIVRGPDNQSLADDSSVEDGASVGVFDLSGHGTAIHNAAASATDNLLAKIVGGKDTGYTTADYMGFMPNGQMTIFRTGGGTGLKKVTSTSPAGTYTMAGTNLATGDTLVLFGKTLTVTRTGNAVSATDGTTTYNGYLGADGLLYLDSNADGTVASQINQGYTMADGKLTLDKQLGQIDYQNYKALLSGGALWAAGDLNDNNGRSRVDILANAAIVPAMRGISTETINTVLASGTSQTDYQTTFINLVNKYYDQDTNDGTGGVTNDLPGTDAMAFFSGLGSSWQPLVLFSTGAYDTGNSSWAGESQTATFENSAPLVFSNLEHLFASVVAVGLTGTGTAGTTSVTNYSPTGKIAVQQWIDQNGTPSDTSEDK